MQVAGKVPVIGKLPIFSCTHAPCTHLSKAAIPEAGLFSLVCCVLSQNNSEADLLALGEALTLLFADLAMGTCKISFLTARADAVCIIANVYQQSCHIGGELPAGIIWERSWPGLQYPS